MQIIKPVYIAWEIEQTCTLGCRFCYSSSWNLLRSGSPTSPPSVETIQEKLVQLKNSFPDLQYINWTGGEPLLRRKELGKIFKASRDLGLKNILSTNGYFSRLGKSWEEFYGMLNEWSEDLDVLALSIDSNDPDINDNVMRVCYDLNDQFGSTIKSNHYADAIQIIEAFKEREFPFALKVNTMVTKQNLKSLPGMIDLLADVPCIWHLIEFNPRQCPQASIDEFMLQPGEFSGLIFELNQKIEADQRPCHFFITTRHYDGNDKPYHFLVINTGGDILLPVGTRHETVGNINSDSEGLRETVSDSISKIVGGDSSRVFNEGNRRILSRYLHRSASVVHSSFSLQWLRDMVSETLQYPINRVDFRGQFMEGKNLSARQEQIADFSKTSLLLHGDYADTKHSPLATTFLLEQPRVGRFLSSAYGILGGTLALLPESGGQRVSPAVVRTPPGLHVPWCFVTRRQKRDFFKKLFISYDDTPEKTFGKDFLKDRLLTADILKEVLSRSCQPQEVDAIVTQVKDYLSVNEKTILTTKLLPATEFLVWIVLSRCIEHILGRLAEIYSEKGSVDPWVTHFLTNNEPTLLIQGEQAQQVVSRFLSDNAFADDVKQRWQSSPNAHNAAVEGEQIVPALWFFLFDPLLTMGLDIPDVFAFRAGAGAGHVAIGSVYLLQSAGIETLDEASRAKRRIGGFFEALAAPTIADQLRELNEQMRKTETEAKQWERNAKVHARIQDDLNVLLERSHDLNRLAMRIDNEMKTAKEGFLRLHDILSPLFIKGIHYYRTTDFVMLPSIPTPTPTPTGSTVYTYTEIKTLHSTGNPAPHASCEDAWDAYKAVLAAAGKDLRMPWLEQFATITKARAKPALDFIKLIIQRPHHELANIYDPQLIFALRLATLEQTATTISTVCGSYTVKFETSTFGGQTVPAFDKWIDATSKLPRPGGQIFFSEDKAGTLIVGGSTDTATVLGALMRLCAELAPQRNQPVKLETIEIKIDDAGTTVVFNCSGTFTDQAALKIDDKSSGRGLRSCLAILCKATNQCQPELMNGNPSSSYCKGLRVYQQLAATDIVFALDRQIAPAPVPRAI